MSNYQRLPEPKDMRADKFREWVVENISKIGNAINLNILNIDQARVEIEWIKSKVLDAENRTKTENTTLNYIYNQYYALLTVYFAKVHEKRRSAHIDVLLFDGEALGDLQSKNVTSKTKEEQEFFKDIVIALEVGYSISSVKARNTDFKRRFYELKKIILHQRQLAASHPNDEPPPTIQLQPTVLPNNRPPAPAQSVQPRSTAQEKLREVAILERSIANLEREKAALTAQLAECNQASTQRRNNLAERNEEVSLLKARQQAQQTELEILNTELEKRKIEYETLKRNSTLFKERSISIVASKDAELASQQQQITTIQQKLDECAQEKKVLQDKIAALLQTQAEKERQILSLQERASPQELALLRAEKQKIAEEVRVMSEKLDQKQRVIDQMQGQLNKCRSDLDAAKKERDAVEAERVSAEADKVQAQAALNAAQREIAENEQTIARLTAELETSNALEEQRASHESDIAALQSRTAELQRGIARLNAALKETENERDNVTQQKNKFAQQIVTDNLLLRNVQKETSEMRATLATLQPIYDQQKKENKELEKNVNDLNSQIGVLTTEIDSKDAAIDALQQQLQTCAGLDEQRAAAEQQLQTMRRDRDEKEKERSAAVQLAANYHAAQSAMEEKIIALENQIAEQNRIIDADNPTSAELDAALEDLARMENERDECNKTLLDKEKELVLLYSSHKRAMDQRDMIAGEKKELAAEMAEVDGFNQAIGQERDALEKEIEQRDKQKVIMQHELNTLRQQRADAEKTAKDAQARIVELKHQLSEALHLPTADLLFSSTIETAALSARLTRQLALLGYNKCSDLEARLQHTVDVAHTLPGINNCDLFIDDDTALMHRKTAIRNRTVISIFEPVRLNPNHYIAVQSRSTLKNYTSFGNETANLCQMSPAETYAIQSTLLLIVSGFFVLNARTEFNNAGAQNALFHDHAFPLIFGSPSLIFACEWDRGRHEFIKAYRVRGIEYALKMLPTDEIEEMENRAWEFENENNNLSAAELNALDRQYALEHTVRRHNQNFDEVFEKLPRRLIKSNTYIFSASLAFAILCNAFAYDPTSARAADNAIAVHQTMLPKILWAERKIDLSQFTPEFLVKEQYTVNEQEDIQHLSHTMHAWLIAFLEYS